jgi:hypothetical protein
MRGFTFALVAALALLAPLGAHVGTQPPGRQAAAADTDEHAFDYLLGDWEFTSVSREYGKGHGVWSAVRLQDGQILDEYRVLGDRNETIYATTTIRNYDERLKRWDLVGSSDGSGLQDIGTAKRVGAEMHIDQTFGTRSERPFVLRIRYYDIAANRFSWRADRSVDRGKTWEANHLQIEARRIGPARSLPSLVRLPGK